LMSDVYQDTQETRGGRAVPLPVSPTAGYNDSPSIHCPGIASLWRLSETIREIPFQFHARPSEQSPFTAHSL
jgi:hypothetical protein